ncbi:MAG: ABC transporter substrate-binding protein [Elainellaceae cyanobacterium]
MTVILGLDFHQSIYDQTSQIAPTALFEFEHSGQWKEVFQTIGSALGKADVAQQVMNAYEQRSEEFKAAMGDRPSTGTQFLDQFLTHHQHWSHQSEFLMVAKRSPTSPKIDHIRHRKR